MSQIGNTTKSFGREYNISISNLGGEQILASDVLRKNTILIDAKVDNNLEDNGSYTLFVTDANGVPVRLTYTMQPGNGLYADPNDTDVLRMCIDENSIMADDGDELYVNKHNIIDCYTLTVNSIEGDTAKRGRIGVVTAHLDPATSTSYGISKGDDITLTTYVDPEYPGQIRVNTQYLDKVDDASNTDGIVRHSSEMSRTIEAVDGKLRVLTENLVKATDSLYGIAKGDENTIMASDGLLTVNTAGLDHADNSSYGIVKGDSTTINISDGVASVITSGLDTATVDRYGTVMLDGYSINVSPVNGKIEVQRFPEIEALLKTNNPEHEVFGRDIEDLKNRVAKLETWALQEKIEFLITVGDPTTELPEPVFDKTTWSVVNKYSDRKTISFQIKTNCKYYINVDYKAGTNDKGQVSLISVQCGSGAVIPANSLSNTPFLATDQTVQTLYFTFAVKNYEEDNNIASVNTNVIITAASINDAAIKQTSFHIFKCWNNSAYEEDKPEYPAIDPPVEKKANWIIENGTEKLQLAKDTSNIITNTLAYSKTGSKNFYFNTYVKATYYDGIPETIDPVDWINQSSAIGSGQYDVKVEYSSTGRDGTWSQSKPAGMEWINTQITASYNSTKRFNVLTAYSNRPLDKAERTAFIKISLPSVTNTVNKINTSVDIPDITYINNAGIRKIKPDITDNIKLEKITDFKVILDKTINPICSPSNNNAITKQTNIIKQANKILTNSNVQLSSRAEILLEDINEFNTIYNNYLNPDPDTNTIQAKLNQDSSYLIDKINHDIYYTYLNKAVKLSDELAKKFNKFVKEADSIVDEALTVSNAGQRSLIFKYTETMDYANPVISVSTSISYNGYNGISYTISRNANSLLNNPDWGVTIKYNFVNKNGDLVDAEGKNTTPLKEYSIPIIKPGTAITYTGHYSNSDVSLASSGKRIDNTTETIYYNVVTISIGTKDRGSLWGIGQGHKDSGFLYWGSYKSDGGTLDKIPDDIYLTFKLTGQGAKYSKNQKHSYWSLNAKNQSNGYEQAFEQANEIEFVGLSKVRYNKSPNATTYKSIKLGNNLYILKNSARTSIQTPECKQSVAAERTLLNNISKEYYNNNTSALVLSKNTIPVEVANNITGIKIKSVTITPDNAFAGTMGEPIISSTGSWKANSGNNSTNANNIKYTFGDARISSMYIEPWDDMSMTIKFTITGGKATNIPNGTTIVETTSSNNGSTKFTFLQDSKSYISTQFYNHYRFSATPWNNNSCTVTYELYNQYSVSKTGIMNDKITLYSKSTNKLQTYYSDVPIKYAMTNISRDAAYQQTPLLVYITGIKFWIGINTSGIVVAKKFESSTSSMGAQVTVSGQFQTVVAKTLSITNALYTSTTTVTNRINTTNISYYNTSYNRY